MCTHGGLHVHIHPDALPHALTPIPTLTHTHTYKHTHRIVNAQKCINLFFPKFLLKINIFETFFKQFLLLCLVLGL